MLRADREVEGMERQSAATSPGDGGTQGATGQTDGVAGQNVNTCLQTVRDWHVVA